MNQVKNRLQTLGLLDRTFAAATDEDITDLVGALDEDHMEALTELVGGEPDAVRVRDGVSRGRLDGTMEGIAIVLTDACLADCIEKLGPDTGLSMIGTLRTKLDRLRARAAQGRVA